MQFAELRGPQPRPAEARCSLTFASVLRRLRPETIESQNIRRRRANIHLVPQFGMRRAQGAQKKAAKDVLGLEKNIEGFDWEMFVA